MRKENGVDRSLDMTPAVVNIADVAVGATIVGRQNGDLDRSVFLGERAIVEE